MERVLEVKETRARAVKPFRIARYPATVAQYRAFIAAEDGWRDAVWWGDDLYRDPEGNTHEFGRFGNHPAVYVSWFDAIAFCRWLSARLGFDYSPAVEGRSGHKTLSLDGRGRRAQRAG